MKTDEKKTKNELITVCMYCKKMCDDEGSWREVETYISAHSKAQFTHGICPDCNETIVKPEMENTIRERERGLRELEKTRVNSTGRNKQNRHLTD